MVVKKTPTAVVKTGKGPGRPAGGKNAPKPVPEALKALRKLTREELVEWGNMVVMGKAKDLLRLENDPDATALEKILSSIVSNIIYKGDMDAFDKLLGRLIGKVEENVHVTGEGALTRVVVTLPSNGREAKK